MVPASSPDRAGPSDEPRASPEPLRLLDERLARGEIDAEQYVEARPLLTHGR